MTDKPGVAVCVVTFNSEGDLPECLAAIGRLDHAPLEVVVVDCASQDSSVQIARDYSGKVELESIALPENIGFAGGMNVAIANTACPFILSLNPDARPRPDYVSRLLESFFRHRDRQPGAVTGRLLRPSRAEGPEILDAVGMYLTMTWRHLDRESGRPDHGQCSAPERVFGATGAASLFSREALEDVAIRGDIFAPEFHSYREDAELSFRLRSRGWEVLYEPSAIAEHSRANVPHRRRQLSTEVNYHSLKNRYLLRIYHQTWSNLLLTLLPTVARDLAILAYALLRERSSLPAYGWLWSRRRWLRAQRRLIQDLRTIPAGELNRWFLRRSLPL